MCHFLLPVDICECNTLQRHLQTDYGWCERTRGLLEGGGHRLLHCTRARQHLSGDRIQVDKIASFGKDNQCDGLIRNKGWLHMAVSRYGSKLSSLQLPHGLTADGPLFVPPHRNTRHILHIDHEDMAWKKTQFISHFRYEWIVLSTPLLFDR